MKKEEIKYVFNIDALKPGDILILANWEDTKLQKYLTSTNSVRYAVSDSGDMRSLAFQVFLRLQS